MAIYLKNGTWYLESGKSLAEVVRENSHWVIEHLIPQVRDGDLHTADEKHEAINDALQVHKERPWSAGCPKCDMITHHNDKGCVECQKEAGK